MIKELSDFGKQMREAQAINGAIVHDAIKDEKVAIDLLINSDGSFDSFLPLPDELVTKAEALTAKKGQARLLMDKAEEVLSYINERTLEKVTSGKGKKAEKIRENYIKGVKSKYDHFQNKLKLFSRTKAIKPVLLFYTENRKTGVEAAVKAFSNQVDDKLQHKNIAFRLVGDTERLNEKEEIVDAVIARFEQEQQSHLSNKKCSICGGTAFPVIDRPHGMIKNVPGGQSSGTALVSYNENAFESYGLTGNENCSICTNCARNYVEGLNKLLSAGYSKSITDKKGKEKTVWIYNNRRDFHTKDTAIIYWTRLNANLNEVALLEAPDEGQISMLFDSVATTKESAIPDADSFYSCTLSGSAARIALRDWVTISLKEYKKNIAKWFKDIEIVAYGRICHSPIGLLSESAESKKSASNTLKLRVITYLWSAAIKHTAPPLWVLQTVLKQTRYIEYFESGGKKTPKEPITKERAALIRLILNRNNNGGIVMDSQLDRNNKLPAYVCGQIFAVLVAIQEKAMKQDLNSGIRERFFSFASTTPAAAFGRLMKLSQNHLSKIRIAAPKLFDSFDGKLREVCADLENGFPALLTLEEQGQFALGYYHKKQALDDNDKYDNKKDPNELDL